MNTGEPKMKPKQTFSSQIAQLFIVGTIALAGTQSAHADAKPEPPPVPAHLEVPAGPISSTGIVCCIFANSPPRFGEG
jgi:hypothetical protein